MTDSDYQVLAKSNLEELKTLLTEVKQTDLLINRSRLQLIRLTKYTVELRSKIVRCISDSLKITEYIQRHRIKRSIESREVNLLMMLYVIDSQYHGIQFKRLQDESYDLIEAIIIRMESDRSKISTLIEAYEKMLIDLNRPSSWMDWLARFI